MVVVIGNSQEAWALQKDVPPPRRAPSEESACLLTVQSSTAQTQAVIRCHGRQLNPTSTQLLFQIVPSPLGAVFRLELLVHPPQKTATSSGGSETVQMNATEQKRFEDERLVVEFSAYVDGNKRLLRPRQPSTSPLSSPPTTPPAMELWCSAYLSLISDADCCDSYICAT